MPEGKTVLVELPVHLVERMGSTTRLPSRLDTQKARDENEVATACRRALEEGGGDEGLGIRATDHKGPAPELAVGIRKALDDYDAVELRGLGDVEYDRRYTLRALRLLTAIRSLAATIPDEVVAEGGDVGDRKSQPEGTNQ